MWSRITRKEKKDISPQAPSAKVNELLPRLQIMDVSSSSKPDNYRVSPITPNGSSEKSPLEDWLGRGESHVDFLPNESVPLTEGRFLGHGVNGGVWETSIRGQNFAWKRRYCKRQIGDAEKREIEILKKVVHRHVIQLVGTYTHRQFLGLLLHPVAECDLAIFVEDIEAWNEQQPLDPTRKTRLTNLGGLDPEKHSFRAIMGRVVFTQLGCLVSAVEYLHDQKIRHKDLKPSNILLSKGHIWLTDFGSATDFSLLSVSATENGGGTPRYVAPEVAQFQPSGRAADMFSLGCIILELLVLNMRGSLKELKALRPAKDGSYQANLERTFEWYAHIGVAESSRGRHLLSEVMGLLSPDPQKRPTAKELCERLAFVDQSGREDRDVSLFGHCCKKRFFTMSEHEEKMTKLDELRRGELDEMRHTTIDLEMQYRRAAALVRVSEDKLFAKIKHHNGEIEKTRLEISNLQAYIEHTKEQNSIEKESWMQKNRELTLQIEQYKRVSVLKDREHERVLELTYANFDHHIGQMKERVREARESRPRKNVSSTTVSPDHG